MALKYIAGKRLKVAGGWREPGDEVPEAVEWRRLDAYLNDGSIRLVEVVGGEQASPAPAPAPEPEPVPEPFALEEEYQWDDEEDEVDLSSLLKSELIALARDRGLDMGGTKAELIERLSG